MKREKRDVLPWVSHPKAATDIADWFTLSGLFLLPCQRREVQEERLEGSWVKAVRNLEASPLIPALFHHLPQFSAAVHNWVPSPCCLHPHTPPHITLILAFPKQNKKQNVLLGWSLAIYLEVYSDMGETFTVLSLSLHFIAWLGQFRPRVS